MHTCIVGNGGRTKSMGGGPHGIIDRCVFRHTFRVILLGKAVHVQYCTQVIRTLRAWCGCRMVVVIPLVYSPDLTGSGGSLVVHYRKESLRENNMPMSCS